MKKVNKMTKEKLYQESIKKYGKVLSKYLIRDIILEHDIETAVTILKESYQDELEYNKNHKGDE